MSSGFHLPEFYDMAEVYEDILNEIEKLQRWLPCYERYVLESEHGCMCHRDGGYHQDHEDEPLAEHLRRCREEEIERLEDTKSKIKELEEIRKIMFDNGERRKLALLALVMKRRK